MEKPGARVKPYGVQTPFRRLSLVEKLSFAVLETGGRAFVVSYTTLAMHDVRTDVKAEIPGHILRAAERNADGCRISLV